jgi:hypothetical protein
MQASAGLNVSDCIFWDFMARKFLTINMPDGIDLTLCYTMTIFPN